jgi:hypothetical protein
MTRFRLVAALAAALVFAVAAQEMSLGELAGPADQGPHPCTSSHAKPDPSPRGARCRRRAPVAPVRQAVRSLRHLGPATVPWFDRDRT